MAFGRGEWVRVVNSVLNLKSTNQVQQLLTVSLIDPQIGSEIVIEFTLPRRAAKGELMLFSFCFIGKQVRQVTVQFAFPCSL